MTRTMLDGISEPDVAAAVAKMAAAIVAGYDDGKWPDYAALLAALPTLKHLSITVTASQRARVLDVENGDATPAQAPGWVLDQRVAGDPYPWVYVSLDNWATVKQAFADQGIAPPIYWVAEYDGDPTIPDGAGAKQHTNTPGYDISSVLDYIPGLDPAPTTPSTILEEDPMQIEPLSTHPGEYAIAAPGKTQLVLVADGYAEAPASLRIAMWTGDGVTVLNNVVLGGSSTHHTVGHTLPADCTGVTVRRRDAEDYPVGITLA